jgi:hypothetical protein
MNVSWYTELVTLIQEKLMMMKIHQYHDTSEGNLGLVFLQKYSKYKKNNIGLVTAAKNTVSQIR